MLPRLIILFMFLVTGYPCHFPLNVEDGEFTLDGYFTGSQFTVTCNDGYTASADNDAVICNDLGQWVNRVSCQGRCLLYLKIPKGYVKGLGPVERLSLNLKKKTKMA